MILQILCIVAVFVFSVIGVAIDTAITRRQIEKDFGCDVKVELVK